MGLSFGAMHSARRGTGSDVAGSRPYVPGDNVKAIDWAASARLSSARGHHDFILREHYAEEAPRVVVICDRRPEMGLFPKGLPWLRKPDAQRAALELIRASTVEAHGFIGYLDFGEGEGEPFWLPPHSQSLWEYQEREEDGAQFRAPSSNVEDAFEFLFAHPRSVPAGTFVFVLSDFLAPPPVEAWVEALAHGWDVVPVAIQDPVWEQSFPRVAGVGLPIEDPRTGAVAVVRLGARAAAGRRAANEERLRRTLDELAGLGLDPVVIGTSDPHAIDAELIAWAELRRQRRWAR